MTPVKVVHLVTLLELGGAQGNTLHTVNHLDPQHFEAHLWCGRGAYWDAEATKLLSSSGRLHFFSRLVRPIHPLFDLWVIFDLWRELRRLKPQIIHTHSSKAGIVGRIAAHLAGVPIIIHTFHGFGFNDQQSALIRRIFVALERFCARFSHRLIFVSHSNWNTAKQLGIGNESSYVMIRSGIPLNALKGENPAKARPDVRKEFSFPPNCPLVVTVGAFKPQKNLSDFLILASKTPNTETRFLIVGDGDLRSSLERKARELGVDGRVAMPGWRTDVGRLLSAADIFVLTSLWEGLPRALAEAMALGLPCVCYDTDGVRDLLGGTTRLIAQGDVDNLASQVNALLANPQKRESIGQKNQASIREEFDIDRMVRQQEILYNELLSRSHPASA